MERINTIIIFIFITFWSLISVYAIKDINNKIELLEAFKDAQLADKDCNESR